MVRWRVHPARQRDRQTPLWLAGIPRDAGHALWSARRSISLRGMTNVETSQRRQSTPALSAEALPDRIGSTAGVPSQQPLFRQEVVEFQRHNRQWGRVVPLQPLPTRLMVWSLAA